MIISSVNAFLDHGGGQSLPRYLIPCALPFESAAHDTPQTDPRFYIHPDVPLQMIHGSSPRKSMTDATKIKSLRGNNAVSCELLDTPDLTRRRIPMFNRRNKQILEEYN